MSLENSEFILRKWWADEDVVSLCRLFFGVRLEEGEVEIVRCVAFDTHPRVVISCLTRYGKSFSVSMGILLWILKNSNKRIAIIAPTKEKTSIIRNYLAMFVVMSPAFSGLLDTGRSGVDRIRKEVSKNRMTWKNGVEMRTLTAEGQGHALMGFGADKVIVDETCDIKFEVYRSKITRMLGDNPETATYVEIGNPWHRDNQMWQHWKDPSWKQIHISWRQALKEGRITQSFIDEQRATLTEREFTVLYDAEFPEESEDQLIKWQWIQDSINRKCPDADFVWVAGQDVAERGNDLSVFILGKKYVNGFIEVVHIFEWEKTETMASSGKIADLLNTYKVNRLTVDSNGLGAGVFSRLKELKAEGKITCIIKEYRGGVQPTNESAKNRFLNMKAQSYFNLRELFEKGMISIPKHTTLVDQLSKMKWERTSSMKIKINDPGTKEGDTAEEKSPDYADSLNYCCWEGIQIGYAL